MKRTETGYSLKVEVPGFDKENIKASYTKPYLSVTAEQTEGEGELTTKRTYSFRTYLPNIDASAITSSLKNGVLNLTLPKKVEELPNHIDIKLIGDDK
jgi:HSP20 family protein